MNSVRMRRTLITLCLLLPLFGCSTGAPVGANDPVIVVEQLPASEFAVRRGAAGSVAYQITVKNPRAESITLRRVELSTGVRSPYRIERGEPIETDLTIGPGAEESTVFEAWVIRSEQHSEGMVHLQGVAHFLCASGDFAVEFWHGYREP